MSCVDVAHYLLSKHLVQRGDGAKIASERWLKSGGLLMTLISEPYNRFKRSRVAASAVSKEGVDD